jgi:hypothetical protein
MKKKKTGRPYILVCQEFEESESGWGTRPDGYSLHRTHEESTRFTKIIVAKWRREEQKEYGGSIPSVYSRPAGPPFEVKVDKKTYDRYKEGGWADLTGACPFPRYYS